MRYHPDKIIAENPNISATENQMAEETFRAINDAYALLLKNSDSTGAIGTA